MSLCLGLFFLHFYTEMNKSRTGFLAQPSWTHLHECMDTLGFASAGGAQGHHAVTYTLGLKQLDQLQHPRSVVDQSRLRYLANKKQWTHPNMGNTWDSVFSPYFM